MTKRKIKVGKTNFLNWFKLSKNKNKLNYFSKFKNLIINLMYLSMCSKNCSNFGSIHFLKYFVNLGVLLLFNLFIFFDWDNSFGCLEHHRKYKKLFIKRLGVADVEYLITSWTFLLFLLFIFISRPILTLIHVYRIPSIYVVTENNNLHMSKNQDEFNNLLKITLQRWNKGLIEFYQYFTKHWLESDFCKWQI